MANPRGHARRGWLALVAVAASLAGCEFLDTRPAVEILPATDLMGRDTVAIRVEAGGAPQVRLLVDGVPLGSPVPTGTDLNVDLSPVAEGVHVLEARVEQSTSPRRSAPRRLEVRRLGYRVPMTITDRSGPWQPYLAEVRASEPLARVTVNAWQGGAATLPTTVTPASADRRTWTVAVPGWSLADLGLLSMEVAVEDDMGFPGNGFHSAQMPTRVAVTFREPAGSVSPPVRIVAIPAVPVPGATLWGSTVGAGWRQLREVGPSPWDVTLGETDLGPGSWVFEFRRPDVELAGRAEATVLAPSGLATCAVEGGAATITPSRCGLVTYRAPPASVALEGEIAGWPPPPGLAAIPVSDRSWRVCPSDVRWKTGPGPVPVQVVARDAGGAVLERTPCTLTIGWQWGDPGADPVTDGVAALRGRVLALHTPSASASRLAILARSADPGAGEIRVAVAAGPGAFTPGPSLAGSPASAAAASLGPASAISWTQASAPGIAEGLLQAALGAAWSPWPLLADPSRATRSPAVAAGAQVAAWVEDRGDGTTSIQVRMAGVGSLPPILPSATGARLEEPAVAAAGPDGVAPLVAFLEVLSDDTQRVHVQGWDGTSWRAVASEIPAAYLGPRSTDRARTHLAADASRAFLYLHSRAKGLRGFAWKRTGTLTPYWEPGPGLLEPSSGVVRTDAAATGLPADGRAAVIFTAFQRPADGMAEIWACPTLWGYECASLGPVPGAPVEAVAVDPDAMSVAWTAGDGTVHVRTLLP